MTSDDKIQPDEPQRRHRPWWFTLLLILLVLPAFGLPWLLVSAPEGSLLMMLIRLFPFYLVASAICAWYAYPQRRDVAWILVAMMIITSSALYQL